MLTYDRLLNVTLPPLIPSPILVPLVAGTVARTAIAIVASPLEMLRTNLQSTPLSPEKPITLRSTLRSLRTLVRTDGIQSLWRGLPPTLWRDVPFSGIYWSGYEWWKRTFAKYGHSGLGAVFLSGSISGMVAASITLPFDVLKTRRQALLMTSSGSRSIIPLTKHIVRTEGVKALFSGIGPRLAKIVPACGIMISSYEVRNLHPSSAHLC
jgi:solute carrier family 25, member 39/40